MDIDARPTRLPVPAPDVRVVDALADLSRWHEVESADIALEAHRNSPRVRGDIAVSVAAGERGIELELRPMPTAAWPYGRYVVLEATDPRPIPGRPTSLGLWVKGNSSWGRVFWEFEDASGRRFASTGCEPEWYIGDDSGSTCFNFDGWNYISLELPCQYADGRPAPPYHDWMPTGERDWRVQFPIKVTRLMFELRDRVIYLYRDVPVPVAPVRVRDLSAGYTPLEY
jgi:hypothetical protein